MTMTPLPPFASLLLVLGLLTGCTSVPMASGGDDAASKTFAAPPPDRAGLYVFRDATVGKSLEKEVFVDGLSIGRTVNGVFLFCLIAPGPHKLGTESEFSTNEILFNAMPGTNHFFEQHLETGVHIGKTELRAVVTEEGQARVLACDLALTTTPPVSDMQLP
jgi:hypothetical protein